MTGRSRKIEKKPRDPDRGEESAEGGRDADLTSEPLADDVTFAAAEGSGSKEPPRKADAVATLKVKIASAADVESTLERLQHVSGLRDVEPLFPGETHPDLSKIVVAHVDADRMAEAIKEVEADDDVEYVDGPAPRTVQ